MFLTTFSLNERKSFLALAIHLVHTDGEFAAQEEQRLRALRRVMALPADTDIPDDPISALPAPFTTREARVKVIIELLKLAYVDGVFDRRERSMIQDIGDRFGLQRDELDRMEDWTTRLNQLRQEAESLWTKN